MKSKRLIPPKEDIDFKELEGRSREEREYWLRNVVFKKEFEAFEKILSEGITGEDVEILIKDIKAVYEIVGKPTIGFKPKYKIVELP